MTSPGASRLRPFVLTLAIVIALVPLLSLLLDSFRPPQAFFGSSFFTNEWTTQNYTGAFSSEGGTFTALVNSLIVASATTVISVVLGTLAAFGLARVRYGWTIPVTYAILAVRFYPKITTILPYYVMVRSFHLLFTVTAVIIAHVSITLPLVVLIMITFFNRDPEGSRRSRGHGRVLGVVVFSSRHIAAGPARTGDKCRPNRDVLLERVPHRLECDRSNVTDVAGANLDLHDR